MMVKRKKYILKKGRLSKMASIRVSAGNTATKRGGRAVDILSSYAESLSLTIDRKKANAIHKARKEASEGKTVPLRSLMK